VHISKRVHAVGRAKQPGTVAKHDSVVVLESDVAQQALRIRINRISKVEALGVDKSNVTACGLATYLRKRGIRRQHGNPEQQEYCGYGVTKVHAVPLTE
jgi:hypothetical protein